MVLPITLSISYTSKVTKLLKPRLGTLPNMPYKALYSSCTDIFLDNLVIEEGNKNKSRLSKYFDNVTQTIIMPTDSLQNLVAVIKDKPSHNSCDALQENSIECLVNHIEKELYKNIVPNEKLHHLLIYYTKDGNVKGVKAVQNVIKKHNSKHYYLQSEYNHYLAEALWICGKFEGSLQLFSITYDNLVIRPKVKVMLTSLFPLLIAQHSEAALHKVVDGIEIFSAQKQDNIILAYLWKELFQSNWFSDQEQAEQLLQKNTNLLTCIQWMIPLMGKDMLKKHKIDDYYRLLQFTLENKSKTMTGLLVRLLFEYFYIHNDIKRCTSVIKYSTNWDSPLTEDQQRRYVTLLLQSKDSSFSKLNVKKPQNLEYKF